MSKILLPFLHSTVNCPGCRNPVTFRSVYTNTKQCPYCNTILQRYEVQDTARKTELIAANRPFSNLIAIGAMGRYENKDFEVIGAAYCDMERFYNNRWTILFSDGNIALLTETLGFYAIQKPIKVDYPAKLSQLNGMDNGLETVELFPGSKMRVFDKAKSENSFYSGEISWPDADGQLSITELADINNRRIEVVEYAKNQFEIYDITYLLLEELSLTNPFYNKATPATHTCTKCGKSITIKNPLYTQYCMCPSCNTLCRFRRGIGLVSKDKKLKPLTPQIPLGSKGKIDGIEYEMTGAIKKYESGSIETTWTEYALFNEERGFAFISEYNGHFILLKEVKRGFPYPNYSKEIIVDDENYVLFNEYSFDFVAATGEFHTSFNKGAVKAKEYISPPEMYVVERNDNKEITWYKGDHISSADIFRAFNLPAEAMPRAYGIGPLQPMKGYINMLLLRNMGLIAFAVFFAVQTFFSANAKDEVVFSRVFTVDDSIGSKGIVTNSFELKPSSSNLQFLISAPVSNSWFNADITLVNEKTGKEYSLDKGVEFYSGYSDGEAWTEGSTEEEAMLSSVPGGSYHLNIFPSSGGGRQVNSFSLTARNDVPMWRNFFIIVGILALFPIVQWLRMQAFERMRWNNSPHNPYSKDK